MSVGVPSEPAAATVVIPTLGRDKMLRVCLESLRACSPRASEVLLVAAGGSIEVALIAAEFDDLGVRVVREERRGTAAAANQGLRAAAHDLVLLTHDDCVVGAGWVGAASAAMADRPGAILTGRVLPLGDPQSTPGLATSSERRDYSGTRARVLVAHNMACSRSAVLALGGFDERLPVCEDDDLAYRWLRAGGALLYVPELEIWHAEWRSPEQLRARYRAYSRGDGMYYAKHVMAGDLGVLRYIGEDLRAALRGEIAAAVHGERRPWDFRLAIAAGLPAGLWQGLRTFGRGRGR